jgi:hypothetical protein
MKVPAPGNFLTLTAATCSAAKKSITNDRFMITGGKAPRKYFRVGLMYYALDTQHKNKSRSLSVTW